MLTNEHTYRKTLERLREMDREGALDEAARLYFELITIQLEAKIEAPVCHSSSEVASERLKKGLPIISFEHFSPDWNEVSRIFAKLIVWAGEGPNSDKTAKKSCEPSEVAELARKWYERTSEEVPLAENESFLMAVVGAALKPFLVSCMLTLLPLVEQESWRRDYCPVCGGKPDFVYLEKDAGARWLVCSRCDGEWLYFRLKCPYCSTQNQDALGYFFEEGAPYRVYLCNNCRKYIKAIDLRMTAGEVLLPLERIKTLPLDRKACEDGYKPG